MRLFISHFHKEAAIAKAIKEVVVECFKGKVHVFLSEDIPYGKNWLATIREELKDVQLLLTLFSRKSMNRPWINIETGYAIMREINVIPICCLGLAPTELSDAYRTINSIALDRDQDIRKLFTDTIASALKMNIDQEVDHFVVRFREHVSKAVRQHLSYQVLDLRVEAGTITFFPIVNKATGKCVDVRAMSVENDAEVIGFPFQGNENQLWQFERIGNHSFLIRSKQTGKCLQVKDDGAKGSKYVQVHDYLGERHNSQHWTLTKLEDGAYKINVKGVDLCLSMKKSLNKDDPPILLQRWGNGIEQRWWLQIHVNPELMY